MFSRAFWVVLLLSTCSLSHGDELGACSSAGSQVDSHDSKQILVEKVQCLYGDIASHVGGERARIENPEVQYKFREEQRRLREIADHLSQEIGAVCPSLDKSCSLYQSAEGMNLILNRNAALEVARFQIPEDMFPMVMANSLSVAWVKATHIGLLKAE